MKKSFLPLLAGLIGIAGITSASAWHGVSIPEIRDSISRYYSASPLKATNGVGLHVTANGESVSFNDGYNNGTSLDRRYVFNYYPSNFEIYESDKAPKYWLACSDKDNCSDSKNEAARCAVGNRIATTTAGSTASKFGGENQVYIKEKLNTCFNKGNDRVLFVLDTLKYKFPSNPDVYDSWVYMAPTSGWFSPTNAHFSSRGMYSVEFYRPPTDTKVWLSWYSDSSLLIKTYNQNSTNQPLYIQPTRESVKFSYTGKVYAAAERTFQYRENYYSGTGYVTGSWKNCSTKQSINSAGTTNQDYFILIGKNGSGNLCDIHDIASSTNDMEVRAITRQVFSSAMEYEKTYVADTVLQRISFKRNFVINSPYDETTASNKGGTYSFGERSNLTSMTNFVGSPNGFETKIKATSNSGYNFKGWYDRNNKLISTSSELTIKFIRDTLLTPHFEEYTTSFKMSLTNRTGSSTTISSDGSTSEFALSKDQISLSATATATGNTKIQLQYCTESQRINCTGTKLKNIGSEFTFGSANPNNYTATIATISNEGKLTIKSTSTTVSLPTNVAKVWIFATMNRYNTLGTKLDYKTDYIALNWKYPVEFMKNDGTSSITTYYVSYGGSVAIPTANLGVPASTGTIRYDYYWQDMNSASTTYTKTATTISDITTAKKIKVVLSTEYLVQFVDFDGNPFTVKGTKASDAEQWIVAGQSAKTPATNPDHKQNSNYSFSKWDKSYSNIGAPTTITAVYLNKITYATPTNAAWKTVWMLNGATPTNYTPPTIDGYKFVNWTPSFVTVSGPATYTAKYVKVPEINFTVKGYVIGSTKNDLVVESPTKCFVETGRELYLDDGMEQFFYSQGTNDFEITFNIDRSGDCANDELIKAIDEASQYSSIAIVPDIYLTEKDVTVKNCSGNDHSGNIDVAANKASGKINSFSIYVSNTPADAYLITFKDTDGETVLQSSYVLKDQMPTAPTSYTIPENTAQYKYSFDNWDPTIEKATKDQTYKAQLKTEIQVYTVRFLDDYNGNQIGESQTVEYNGKATLPDKSLEPKKEGFYFSGWTASNSKITKDTDYWPVFTKNPDMSFTVSGMTAGNSTLNVENGPSFLPDGCYAVSKAMLYDKNDDFVTAANPMIAGETYTWKATISTFENRECVEASDDIAYAEYSEYFHWMLNSVVPAYVNGVVANDDVTNANIVIDNNNGYVESVTFDVAYTFVAEAAEEGDDDSSSSAAEEEGDKNSSSSAAEEEGDNDSSSSAAEDEGDNDSSSSAAEEGDKNSSSSADEEEGDNDSSSSVKPDDSDKNSSSSAAEEGDKSSSSSAKDDAEESSSSSKRPKSSSSSADDEDGDDDDDEEDESSSSAKPNAIVTFDIPTFKATVSGRNLSIFGATVGAKTAIFDLQGSVISTGRVEAANFNVSLPRSGMYVVRIGNQIQKVNVR